MIQGLILAPQMQGLFQIIAKIHPFGDVAMPCSKANLWFCCVGCSGDEESITFDNITAADGPVCLGANPDGGAYF
jgi:hypothetical protein